MRVLAAGVPMRRWWRPWARDTGTQARHSGEHAHQGRGHLGHTTVPGLVSWLLAWLVSEPAGSWPGWSPNLLAAGCRDRVFGCWVSGTGYLAAGTGYLAAETGDGTGVWLPLVFGCR